MDNYLMYTRIWGAATFTTSKNTTTVFLIKSGCVFVNFVFSCIFGNIFLSTVKITPYYCHKHSFTVIFTSMKFNKGCQIHSYSYFKTFSSLMGKIQISYLYHFVKKISSVKLIIVYLFQFALSKLES